MFGHLQLALIVTQWLALIAISSLLLRTLGWTELKQHPLTIAALVLSLMAAPLGGLLMLARPHSNRIMALLRPSQSPPILLPSGCPFFPEDNIWNTGVRDLPVDSRSDQYIETMGPDTPLHPDFGSAYGYEFSVVGGDEKVADVTFVENPAESDPGPYRIPDNAAVEQGPDGHLLAIDPAHCELYELYAAKRTGSHQWEAGSGAIFDLRSNHLRPEGWTSADAAGLPMLHGFVRYDEVKSGSIRHALRFTTLRTRNAFVWPARHRASSSTSPNLPAMGQRFRLRNSFDVSGYSPETQVILTALKEYGMILADNGGPWFLSGARDSRWPSQVLSELRRLHGADFEAVDSSLLMLASDSGQARQDSLSLTPSLAGSKNK
jgi:hypothetical protein